MKIFSAAGFSLVFLAMVYGCSKTYTLSPVTPATATPTPIATSTPTLTSTPCGFPGNTCTWTFTPTVTNTPTQTSTFTATGTPTNTATAAATSTFTPLPTPQGFFGLQDGLNDPTVVWVKDTNPNITAYKLYVSTDDVTWVLLSGAAIPKSAFTNPYYCQVNDTTQAAPFTRYYYVVASNGGSPPDSPPSPQVWAVSGTTTVNTMTYTVTFSNPLNIAQSGTLPAGAVNQIWVVEDTSQNQYWTWGEGATSLTSVNYGYNATGVTYVPSQTLTVGTTYGFGTFTLNSHNWVIDRSATGYVYP